MSRTPAPPSARRARRGSIGAAALRAGLPLWLGACLLVLPLPGTTSTALIAQEAGDGGEQVTRDTTSRDSSVRSSDLLGQVASRETGAPIDGAQISLPELGVGTVTGPEGEFRISNLPAGEYGVRVQYLGFLTNERPLRFEPGHVTRAVFLLERDVLRVADLEVVVKREESAGPRSGFRRRMERRRFGEFITREEIVAENPQHTSDMLREIPGVKVTRVEAGQASVLMRASNGSLCPPTVFLDGLPAEGFQIDNLQPAAVGGIELYRRPSEAPTEFKGAGASGCGVLVIWSHTGEVDGF